MQRWAPRLRDDLGISIEASNALATSIAADIRVLSGRVFASCWVIACDSVQQIFRADRSKRGEIAFPDLAQCAALSSLPKSGIDLIVNEEAIELIGGEIFWI